MNGMTLELQTYYPLRTFKTETLEFLLDLNKPNKKIMLCSVEIFLFCNILYSFFYLVYLLYTDHQFILVSIHCCGFADSFSV